MSGAKNAEFWSVLCCEALRKESELIVRTGLYNVIVNTLYPSLVLSGSFVGTVKKCRCCPFFKGGLSGCPLITVGSQQLWTKLIHIGWCGVVFLTFFIFPVNMNRISGKPSSQRGDVCSNAAAILRTPVIACKYRVPVWSQASSFVVAAGTSVFF
jgi:hypothetical protein